MRCMCLQVPPPLNIADLPESLAATLQHIVGQLDVLTQVGLRLCAQSLRPQASWASSTHATASPEHALGYVMPAAGGCCWLGSPAVSSRSPAWPLVFMMG